MSFAMRMVCVGVVICLVLRDAAAATSEVMQQASKPLSTGMLTRSLLQTTSSCGKFPKNFLWGYGGSAFQTEGALSKDGRTPSIWDVHCRKGKCNGEQADPGVGFYTKYKSDIALLKASGAKAFRFSISWTRLIPGGVRGSAVNPKAVKFYNNVINECLKNGIKPVVTLYHWDLPANLENPNNPNAGWMGRAVVSHFEYYATQAFKLFGDRVKAWLTLNEPYTFCMVGYWYGGHAPGKTMKESIYKCGHNALLAHAKAVNVYRTKFKAVQKGQISIALNSDWSEPLTSNDYNAAQRDMEFRLGWFADPLYFGDYPASMKKKLGSRLPSFTPAEKKLLKGSADFFGLNYYTANYVKDEQYSWMDSGATPQKTNSKGEAIGPQADSATWLNVVPWGFNKILVWVQKRYKNPVIWITETGVDVPGERWKSWPDAKNDAFRSQFYASYLDNLCKARKESGVRIGAFLAWSFLDNFEWAEGSSKRFGVIYVDYSNKLKRYRKASSYFLQRFWADRTA